ncbi:hypothetical protein AKJ09_04830 [Labilithrix luteola]|uniref:Uncharacterized protein n=1 Tax=Labilithrix luteola TaxID=1391654 RepID=A0A0K1PXP8_9BACT|nr:hypothetical protein AKJ09_04830 [Labilithrix luteola]
MPIIAKVPCRRHLDASVLVLETVRDFSLRREGNRGACRAASRGNTIG